MCTETYDPEFKFQVRVMLERFLEENLGVVDTADKKQKIIGIPFVVQNIVKFLVR